MTHCVTIHRGGRNTTSRLPWGVYLGGVQAGQFATLAEAKEFARERYGITSWTREATGYYLEAM